MCTVCTHSYVCAPGCMYDVYYLVIHILHVCHVVPVCTHLAPSKVAFIVLVQVPGVFSSWFSI